MIGSRIQEIHLVEPTSWWFTFRGGGSIRVETLWRVIAEGTIQVTSTDHRHTFGLMEPVDSAIRAVQAMSSAAVRQASVRSDTGDVVVVFENDTTLEILTTSSGYESWSVFSPDGEEAIGPPRKGVL